jgi:heptaprenyl diphosphate synthase
MLAEAKPTSSHILLDEAFRWFDEFLCQPHERIGRSGDVCPFVSSALRSETLKVQAVTVPADLSLDDGVALVGRMASVFRSTVWEHANSVLHALAFVLDGLPDGRLQILDELHAMVKPALVREGLMIGQFHKRCPESAARNPEFLVARSPVPILVLRNIAFHDVLFLSDDAELFAAYDSRFGFHYSQGNTIDPLLARIYSEARRKFTSQIGEPLT